MILGITLFYHSNTTHTRSFPSKPIKLVVPFSAGGGTDAFARMMEQAIATEHSLPTDLYIVNKEGAGATVGSSHVKDSQPDGYTLLLLHETILTAKYSGLANYGPEAFTPIAGTGQAGMVISVLESSPYHSLAELLNAAAEKPDSILFGANKGALTHYAQLWLEKAKPGAGFRFVQSGGGSVRLGDLLGGHTDVTGFSSEEFIRFRSAGLRGLAYFGNNRHPGATDVPTAIEQGFDITASSLFYWWAPKGTPAERVEYLADALETTFHSDLVQQKLQEMQLEPVFLRGEQLQQRIQQSEQAISSIELKGSQAVPDFLKIILVILTGLLLWMFVLYLWQWKFRIRPLNTTPQNQVPFPESEGSNRNGLAFLTVSLCLCYVYAMQTDLLNFRSATCLFLFLSGFLLMKKTFANLRTITLLSCGLSWTIFLLFTQIFIVDLP